MNFTGQHVDDKLVVRLLADIKQKKELRTLSGNFVRGQLLLFLERNPKVLRYLLEQPSSRAEKYKQLIKELRKNLRRTYGVFQLDKEIKERQQLVEELVTKNPKNGKNLVERILATHASTKERLLFYEELYRKIFLMTGKPQRVLDLGSGLNPFSIPLMHLRKLDFSAYDISDEEVNTLTDFFAFLQRQNKHFSGHAETLDLFHWEQLKKLKKADVCFLFKMTDVLDRGKGHKATESVLREVPARFVVISFPTKTLSGKRMNFPKRRWIELLCNRLGFSFRVLQFPNEVFYVIEKKSESEE